jgi:hypothetical protein
LLAEQRFAEVAPSEIPIMETWYVEKEDGSRSTTYDTRDQAKAALPDHCSLQAQMSPHYSRPVHFVSSNGVKIEIPRAATP